MKIRMLKSLYFLMCFFTSTVVLAVPSNVDVSFIQSIPAGVHGMAVADNGDLYFSDSFGNYNAIRKVYRLAAPYTGVLEQTPIVGELPAGLLWDNNTLYVADTQSSTIRQFDSNYNLMNTWNVDAPWLIKKSNDGALLITSYNNRVYRLSNDGAVEVVIDGLAAPFGLELALDNSLWVSEQGSGAGLPGYLKRWSLSGELLQEVEHNWDNPEGLQLDSEGSLWVADTGAGEILRISNAGELAVIADGLTYPIIITKLPGGNLLFNTSGGSPALYQVTFEPICPPTLPHAEFQAEIIENTVSFNSEGSQGCNLTYQWDFGDGHSSTQASAIHTYIAAGDYTVSLTVTDMNGGSGTSLQTVVIDTVNTDTPLVKGSTITDLFADQGTETFYYIDVPFDETSLTVSISGGKGDADLYLKRGSKPTTRSFDCRPFKGGNTETCTENEPTEARYYIMLRAYRDYSGVTLSVR